MKQTYNTLAIVLAVLFLGTFTQCKKDKSDPPPPDYSIETSDANELSKVLKFGNATTISGTLPTTSSTETVDFTHDPSMSVSTGGATTYIPLVYEGTENVEKAFIIVEGATIHYFAYVFPTAQMSGITYVPMTVPKSVNSGTFALEILLVGSNNRIVGNKKMRIPVKVAKPITCADDLFMSGNDGITQTLHELNGKAGNVNIAWETFSVPDRVDVFVDGKWAAGTGSNITPPPPLCDCDNPLPGFIGDNGTFTIPVTASNKIVEVYVSGCLGGGTAWEYEFECVQ